MSRPLRIEYPGAWYHVINRGRRSEKTYLNKNDYQTFISLLTESCGLWEVKISSYSLMPNHYHLLINTPLGNLSRFMRHVNGVYTQRFNKNHKTEGQLFKGRYKCILVNGDGYLLQLVRYIHRNPIRAKMVKNIDNFKWSSHQGYISDSKEWNWLCKNNILSIFSGSKSEAFKDYRNFVSQRDDKDLITTLESKKWPVLMGSEEFKFFIKEKYYQQRQNQEIPESFDFVPDIIVIKDMVCKYYKVNESELNISRRGIFNEPRSAGIYLARKLRRDTLAKIGQEFSIKRYTTVGSSLKKINEMMKNDAELSSRVNELEKKIVSSQSET